MCTVVADAGGSPALADLPSVALGGPSWWWLVLGVTLVATGLVLARRRQAALLIGVATLAVVALTAASPAAATPESEPCPLVRLEVTTPPSDAETAQLGHLLPGDEVGWSRLTVTNIAERSIEVVAEARVVGDLEDHLDTHTSVDGSTDPVVLEPGETRPVHVRLSVPSLGNEFQGRQSSFAVVMTASAR